MAKPWSEVESSKEYKSLPAEEQAAAKTEYFDTVVASKDEYKSLSEEEKTSAKTEFLGEESKPKMGVVESLTAPLLEKVFPGFGEARQSFEQQYPGVIDRARFRGQVGQSFLVGSGAGAVMDKLGVGGVRLAQGSTGGRVLTGAGLGNTMLRGAVEGAAGAQSFDYGSVGNRIMATAGAGLTGGAVGAAVSGAVGAGRAITKSINRIKDPRIPVMSTIKEEISAQKAAMSGISSGASKQIQSTASVGRDIAGEISGRAKTIEEKITSSVQQNKKAINSSIEKTRAGVESAVNSLDTQLSKEADVAAHTFQSKVTGFFRRNSSSYGDELDKVADTISEGGRMTRGEALDVLQRTLQKSASEAEIGGGRVFNSIQDLIQSKYAEQTIKPSLVAGEPATIIQRNLGEQIPFKEFLKDVRNIQKQVKAYRGSSRMSSDEIPAAILNSEFGEFISTLPGGEAFSGLQQAYRPVISYMNKANSVLQPYKGPAYTKTAEELVNRIASGNAAEADKQLVQFLELGTERFGSGIGNVTGKVRQIAENMKTLKTQMQASNLMAEKRMLDIAEEGARKISRIKEAESGALKLVENETAKRSAMIQEEAARLELGIARRLKSLDARSSEVQKLLARRDLVRKIATGIGLTISAIPSGYAIFGFVKGVGNLEDLNR